MTHRPAIRLGLTLTLALAASACAPVNAAPAEAPPAASQLVTRVDVGGYELQIACTGQGSPAVIIVDALGVSTIESGGWWPVMEAIDDRTRVCIYDRAGLGLSDPPRLQPRTSQDAVIDLHRLLAGAPVPGPVVLVGHSVGGLHALLYASQYPSDVAGLVLVNGAHPAQWSALQALLPSKTPGESNRLAQLRALPTDPAANAEHLHVLDSAEQVRAALAGAAPPLGRLPLVVLTRSPRAARSPLLPPEIAEPGDKVLQSLQAELAGLSANSAHLTAAEAGHNLHLYEPQLVVDAIQRILNETASPVD